MNALFAVAQRVGDGTDTATAWRPWFAELCSWAAADAKLFFCGNLFSDNQVTLDTIANDARTEFSFPIDVDGDALSYSDIFEIPPFTRGKLIAWCAKTYGAEFGQAVAANAKNRRFVAEIIMRKASGIPAADPLSGWRIWLNS